MPVLRRLYARAILLQSKLGVAHFNTDLIAQLLQPQLGLAVFELAADIICLGGAVADRNDQVHSHALVRRAAVKQPGEGVRQPAIEAAIGRRGRRGRSAEQGSSGIAGQSRGPIEADQIHLRQQRILGRLLADFAVGKVKIRLFDLRPVIESPLHQVLHNRRRLGRRKLHGVGGDDGRFRQGRAFRHGAGNRIFYQRLLQFQIGLGNDQVLLAGG